MLILTEKNTTYDLDTLPEQITEDLRFCVLDNSNPADSDYFWLPLVFMESFQSPTLKLRIGKHTIRIPVDWQLLIGEPDHGDLEVIPLTSLNDRNFKAFALNPLTSFRPEFLEVEIADIYPETKWFLPKLKNGQLLCVPLTSGEKPLCVYFIKDCPRASEIVKARVAW